jgi:hypothetical protein
LVFLMVFFETPLFARSRPSGRLNNRATSDGVTVIGRTDETRAKMRLTQNAQNTARNCVFDSAARRNIIDSQQLRSRVRSLCARDSEDS